VDESVAALELIGEVRRELLVEGFSGCVLS
jgi:hypothetical protein